jgi:hypothetical protein
MFLSNKGFTLLIFLIREGLYAHPVFYTKVAIVLMISRAVAMLLFHILRERKRLLTLHPFGRPFAMPGQLLALVSLPIVHQSYPIIDGTELESSEKR